MPMKGRPLHVACASRWMPPRLYTHTHAYLRNRRIGRASRSLAVVTSHNHLHMAWAGHHPSSRLPSPPTTSTVKLQMITEVQCPITRFHPSPIRHLTTCNPVFCPIARSNVYHLRHNDELTKADGSQGEAISQQIWRFAIYLARHDSCCIANGLL